MMSENTMRFATRYGALMAARGDRGRMPYRVGMDCGDSAKVKAWMEGHDANPGCRWEEMDRMMAIYSIRHGGERYDGLRGYVDEAWYFGRICGWIDACSFYYSICLIGEKSRQQLIEDSYTRMKRFIIANEMVALYHNYADMFWMLAESSEIDELMGLMQNPGERMRCMEWLAKRDVVIA